MPTKDKSLRDEILIVDGVPMKHIGAIGVGGIQTFDEKIDFIEITPMDSEATFNAKMSNKDRQNLLINFFMYPTNNWLKMHGYPMRRRKR